MISDIKEIISDFKEILKHNLKNVVILLLVLSLLFLGWEHLNAAKTFNTKEAQYKAMCDSLLLVEKKLRFETELAYNKSLADIRDKNKEEIITYYRDIIRNSDELDITGVFISPSVNGERVFIHWETI